MAGPVAVVTDSTAYLPAALAAELGVTVVPLQVVVNGVSRPEDIGSGTEITFDAHDVVSALRADRPVTTSRPSPQVFVDTYRRLRARGFSAVVSVHLSGDISGTVAAARLAASEVAADGFTVEVVDSRSLGMGLGFGVQAAVGALAAGAGPAEAARAAAHRSLNTSIYIYLDTLEFLRRGGRIGAATALLGSALTIKPVLALADGRLEPLERVRTTQRALTRLLELSIAEVSPAGPGEHDGRGTSIAVHHLSAPERAQELADRLREQLPAMGDVPVTEVGPVIGAHVGPGAVGVVVSRPAGA
ncbi:DegV family protein [Kineosporia succinea]|uniref:DegV family protein with EDD domain n=1 Tax=Kineosporia succinea TaxID=84632 RepID=A0ABT9P6B1_9ACTN|nr:DegV family protein [Kineosporia succinea]MDP9827969.1 DegV family protein with EDD domain [Kineosporia succinea]